MKTRRISGGSTRVEYVPFVPPGLTRNTFTTLVRSSRIIFLAGYQDLPFLRHLSCQDTCTLPCIDPGAFRAGLIIVLFIFSIQVKLGAITLPTTEYARQGYHPLQCSTAKIDVEITSDVSSVRAKRRLQENVGVANAFLR